MGRRANSHALCSESAALHQSVPVSRASASESAQAPALLSSPNPRLHELRASKTDSSSPASKNAPFHAWLGRKIQRNPTCINCKNEIAATIATKSPGFECSEICLLPLAIILRAGQEVTFSKGFNSTGGRLCSMATRFGSYHSGNLSDSPNIVTGSSIEKPGVSVAISNSTPPSSRK